MSGEFIPSTGHEITQQRLPPLNYAKFQTKRASVSAYTFTGIYEEWQGFENEVRQNFLSQPWSKSVLSVRQQNPGKHDLNNEMFLVGDELSLSGRFVQQVLHVMTAVGKDLGVPIRFRDHKTVDPSHSKREDDELGSQSTFFLLESQSDNKDPDYAALDNQERARFVGELKTPWTQDFRSLRQNNRRWRRYLGQIANYMKVFDLKYGFWTTYEQTVFLKQEENDQGQWVLRISSIIAFTTLSNLTLGPQQNLRNSVSLRECMLYLMCAAGRSLKGSEARNDDKNFISVSGKGPGESESQQKSKVKESLSQVGGGVPDSDRPVKPPDDPRERQDRARSERATKRALYAPGSGAPLQRMSEASRESSFRRPSPPSKGPGQPERGSTPSSRESSTSGRPQTSTEAKGKQKATDTGFERRSSPATRGASHTGPAEASRARSRSSQRHGREQQQAGRQRIESDDLYGASDKEDRPSVAIPERPARGRSPQPPLPQPPPQPAAAPQAGPAATYQSSQASTRSSAETEPPPAVQSGRRTTRSSGSKRGPTSPKDKLKNFFSKGGRKR